MHLVPRALCTAAVALLAAAPAGAIVGGDADGDAHPATGALYAPGTDGPEIACSATLVSPTVAVTAGHCAAGLDRVWLSFDAIQSSDSELRPGTAHADPAFAGRVGVHDLGVVVLDTPVAGVEPAVLPRAGAVEELARRTVVTAVGFGLHDAADGLDYDGARRAVEAELAGVKAEAVRVDGGPCFGDSGGPLHVGPGATVAAVIAGGSKRCDGKATGTRLDTAAARAFLGAFVDLP